jgi:uncharacterized membrane protein
MTRRLSTAASIVARTTDRARSDPLSFCKLTAKRLQALVDRARSNGMSKPDPRSLVVLAFDSALKSREAYLAFQRLQNEEAVMVHDAVFIEKDERGKTQVTETVDLEAGTSAVRGGLWGALLGTVIAGPIGTLVGAATSAGLGVLSAKLIDLGIPDATVKEIEEAITPGTSALALLLTHIREDGVERELSRFAGAKLVRSDLSAETVQRLRNALTGPG